MADSKVVPYITGAPIGNPCDGFYRIAIGRAMGPFIEHIRVPSGTLFINASLLTGYTVDILH